MRQGTFTGNLIAATAANVKLLSVATAGHLDDAGTATVLGVRTPTLVGGSNATTVIANTLMISGAAAT